MKSETSVRHKLRLTVDLEIEPVNQGASIDELRHTVSTGLRWALRSRVPGFVVCSLDGMRVEPVPADPPEMSPLGAALFSGAADAARAQAADAALQRDLDEPAGYVRCPHCLGLMSDRWTVCMTCLHRR